MGVGEGSEANKTVQEGFANDVSAVRSSGVLLGAVVEALRADERAAL